MTNHTVNNTDRNKTVLKKVVIGLLVGAVLFSGLLAYGVYWVFFDWSRFKQELIAESTSPNGTYTVNAYVSDGGATTSFTVLGELVFNEQNKRSKKIYWQYREENANIEWLDEHTVIINGVQLELPHETYDYRRGVR